MMTKSPLSIQGVKVGLCLPRNTAATCDDNRPRFCPAASTTYHSRVMSFSFKLYVFTLLLLKAGLHPVSKSITHLSQTQTARCDCRSGSIRIDRFQDPIEILWRLFAPP